MKVALAQIDTTPGDLRGNREKMHAFYRRACGLGAGLVVFPELSLPGYPPKDLLDQPDFIRAGLRELKALARAVGSAGLVAGYVEPNLSSRGKPFYNSAGLFHRGKLLSRRRKTLIPTYDVFDEGRYFEPAASNTPVPFQGLKLGLTVCEDAWNDRGFWPRPLYGPDPLRALAKAGADLLVNIAASPYHQGKAALRRRMLERHALRGGVPLLYCALVGGNDELVFDGGSMAVDARGRLAARARSFEEDLVLWDSLAKTPSLRPESLGAAEEVYRALVLGLRDYAAKCGFKKALLGLSGGIDSALVCALAADALGPGQVLGVAMPSMYSSQGSIEDARALAENLGVRLLTIPIHDLHQAARASLSAGLGPEAAGAGPSRGPDLAEQNLQARMRGVILMALSNKTGALLLATGNKSELSVGYCTLYGDMNGGLALIGDVPKTMVYELARFINRDGERIPRASLEKPPSAELKPGQKDQDDLPPYEALDDILRAYVEEGLGAAAIARRGHPPALVSSILERMDASEYKRRQAPPVIKITAKAFGPGRRMPIARGKYR